MTGGRQLQRLPGRQPTGPGPDTGLPERHVITLAGLAAALWPETVDGGINARIAPQRAAGPLSVVQVAPERALGLIEKADVPLLAVVVWFLADLSAVEGVLHAFLSDCRSSALICPRGSVNRPRLPRFGSPVGACAECLRRTDPDMVLRVPCSQATTGQVQRGHLAATGLAAARLPVLRDIGVLRDIDVVRGVDVADGAAWVTAPAPAIHFSRLRGVR
jgi:hypothetical protein